MFVVSEQRLTQLIAPLTPVGVSSEWLRVDGDMTTYGEIYRTQSAVRSVVDFLAGHLARMPVKLFERKDENDRVHLRDHPAQKLLRNPNSYRPNSEFWRDCWIDFLVYDRLAIAKVRGEDGKPTALVRIPAMWYTPFGDNYWRPDFLRIVGSRDMADLDIDDVIYMHGYDPVDPRIGISPLETLKSILEEERAGQKWRNRFWEGNAQPSMVVTRPVEAPDWDQTARDRFIEALRAASNRGKPLLLDEGMAINPAVAFDPKSSQYIEGKKFSREEVLRAYNLPLGLFDPASANFSSIGQYRSMLYAETIAPPISRFTDETESQLLSEWDPAYYDNGLYFEAMIDEKMRGNVLEQLPLLVQATGGKAVLTQDEARGFLSQPSQGGDAAKLDAPAPPAPPGGGGTSAPINPATAGAGGNAGDTGKPENGQPAKSKKLSPSAMAKRIQRRADRAEKHRATLVKFAERQKASTLSRGGGFDAERWDRELKSDLLGVNVETATIFGLLAAKLLGGSYDEERTLAWHDANSEIMAKRINAFTADELKSGDASAVFDSLIDVRMPQLAETTTTSSMSFGENEAAQQNDGKTKTWHVVSDNPRKSHAEMDGEEAKIGEPFSNGMLYPGDPAGGPDETAGCTCIITTE